MIKGDLKGTIGPPLLLADYGTVFGVLVDCAASIPDAEEKPAKIGAFARGPFNNAVDDPNNPNVRDVSSNFDAQMRVVQ